MADWYDVERVKQPGSVVLQTWMAQRLYARMQKESAVGRLISANNLGRAVFSGRNYASFAREAYQMNVIAFRCIELISTAAATIPLLVYRDEDEIEGEHPLIKLLRKPNPVQSGKEFFTSVYAFDLLAGNAYLERAMVGGGKRLQEMYSLRPDRMKIVPGRFGLPAKFTYTVNSLSKDFEVDPITGMGDILHVKRFNPLDDWYGQSPLEAMAMSVDSHNEATRWNFALLKNGARPSGALEYSGTGELPDAEFERLKQEITENYGSGYSDKRPGTLGQQGRPMLLTGGLKWVSMMLTQMEMDWREGKSLSASEIAIGYKVPEQLVGVKGQQTYNNYREARMALYEDAVLPLVDRFTESLTNWFQTIPEFEGLRIGYDEDRIPALALRREAMWERVQNASHLTIDEKREALGYGPYEPDEEAGPGNLIFIGVSDIPLTKDTSTFTLPDDSDASAQIVDEDGQPLDPQDGDQDAPKPKPGAAPVDGAPVANLAMNGAQIQAAVQIVQAVADNTLPPESAIQLLLVAFPSIDEATARAMITPAEDFEPEKPQPPVMMPGVPPQPGNPPKPPKPPKPAETPPEKQVMRALIELKQRRDQELLTKAHEIAYGRKGAQ